jgi:hypothetical protein
VSFAFAFAFAFALSLALALGIVPCVAEDDPDAPPTAATQPEASAATPAAAPGVPPAPPVLPFYPPKLANRPRGKPPETLAEVAARDRAADAAAAPLAFVAEEKWGLAGYNNDEPFYTVLVTNHEPRALRCTVLLDGTFIENGVKESVSDRQTATVQPGAQTPLGNWQGMDRESGAHYSVKCRPL